MLKKSSTSLDSTTPWIEVDRNHKFKQLDRVPKLVTRYNKKARLGLSLWYAALASFSGQKNYFSNRFPLCTYIRAPAEGRGSQLMYRGGERGCRKSEMSNRERHLNHLGVRWESIIGKKRQMQKKKRVEI